MPVKSSRPCGDEELGRGELIELADDAVARGAGEADGRDQRRMPITMPSTVSTMRAGPGEHAGQRFVQQIAHGDARARRLVRLTEAAAADRPGVVHAGVSLGRVGRDMR